LVGLVVGLLAVAAVALAPAGAAARPTPLFPKPTVKILPHRSCKGLLSIDDFPGAVTEGPGPPGLFDEPGSFASICGYYPPEEAQPTELEPEPAKPTGGGEDLLAVFARLDYAPKGKPIDLVTPLVKELSSSENTVTALHGVGTHAYLVIDEEGNGIGIMQVQNDIFEIVKEAPAGIRGLLAKVAGELAGRK
jgi:hypothetical protein